MPVILSRVLVCACLLIPIQIHAQTSIKTAVFLQVCDDSTLLDLVISNYVFWHLTIVTFDQSGNPKVSARFDTRFAPKSRTVKAARYITSGMDQWVQLGSQKYEDFKAEFFSETGKSLDDERVISGHKDFLESCVYTLTQNILSLGKISDEI